MSTAEYVDELVGDKRLRLDDFGAEAMFLSVKGSILREANDVAVGVLLRRLAIAQVDMAEGLDYPLGRAVETFQRALVHFVRALSSDHHVVQKCRFDIATTLILKKDYNDARNELQTIIDASDKPLTIQDNEDSVLKAATLVASLLHVENTPTTPPPPSSPSVVGKRDQLLLSPSLLENVRQLQVI